MKLDSILLLQNKTIKYSILLVVLLSLLITKPITGQDDNKDTDGDGIPDKSEEIYSTDPEKFDSDGDDLSDGKEVLLGTNPLNIDTDGDGLTDGQEIKHNTNPLAKDSDSDGLEDGFEIVKGLNPTVKDSDSDGIPDKSETDYINGKDSDSDGISDLREQIMGTNIKNIDSDNDGISDAKELLYGTDPNNQDTDGDGFDDGEEILKKTNPIKSDKGSDKSETDKDDVDNEINIYEVEIHLSKGTVVKGSIAPDNDKLSLRTDIGDLSYEKEVSLSEIKSIEILEWNPYMSSKYSDSKKKEIQYTFYPSKYKIKLRDGSVYYQKARFENIEVLELENKYGKTSIYLIFVDYWILNSKNSGYWRNSGFSEFDSNNKNPNPLTGVQIDIIRTMKNDSD